MTGKIAAFAVGLCLSVSLLVPPSLAAESLELVFGEPLLPHSRSFETPKPDTITPSRALNQALAGVDLQAFVAATTAPGMPQLNDYFQQTEVRSISMSPDGKKLAIIKRVKKNTYSLLILDMTSGGTLFYAMAEPNNRIIKNVRWLTPTRLGVTVMGLARIAGMQFGYQRMLAIDADGTAPVTLLGVNKKLLNNFDLADVSSFLAQDPDHILMTAYDKSVNLYKVNIFSGKGEIVVKGSTRTFAFITDKLGNPKMRMDLYWRSKSVKIYTWQADRKRWKLMSRIKLNGAEGDIAKQLAAITGVEELVIIARKAGDEYARLHAYNVVTEEFTNTLFGIDGYDLQRTISSGRGGGLIGVSYIKDRPKHHYFVPKLQEVQSLLETQFPNGTVEIINTSNGLREYLFFIDEPWRPGTFYHYDDQTKVISRIVEIAPNLNRTLTTSVDALSYRAPDGTIINSYLTFPNGREGEALPLIVLPHGGPFTRDWLTFDKIVQYWATRGYAVFQPNYRGSTGYGRTFEEAGYKEYGGAMIDDMETGVRALIKAGRVDPDRICSAGFSYGGYAALMLPIKSDLFACAVSINGMSDLTLQFELDLKVVKNATSKKELQEWIDKHIGNLKTEREMLDQQSPLVRYKEIYVPLLLIAAKDDKTVFPVNSRKLNKVMSDAGMSVEYYEYDEGGHSLLWGDTMRRMLSTTERFFYQHIGH